MRWEELKGWPTIRLLRLRRMIRLLDPPLRPDDQETSKALNKELRLRTKRRYGKAV